MADEKLPGKAEIGVDDAVEAVKHNEITINTALEKEALFFGLDYYLALQTKYEVAGYLDSALIEQANALRKIYRQLIIDLGLNKKEDAFKWLRYGIIDLGHEEEILKFVQSNAVEYPPEEQDRQNAIFFMNKNKQIVEPESR